jgi:hypothetical protein
MKRVLRILPVMVLVFISISRGWLTSIRSVAARTFGPPQSGTLTTQYAYDSNGRLTMVYIPSDDAVFYSYDPAGNITQVRRAAPLELLSLAPTPTQGCPNSQVTFTGIGFSAGVTSVLFNGTPSTTFQATPPTLVATVPATATTGPITITTPRGSVMTSVFTVLHNGTGSGINCP